ncbi:hypothetical protein JL722_10369 [Aureococcus anophagefferens]|nr:hypothetical protein JL722_10369 [Aureococcus anophagefferens]
MSDPPALGAAAPTTSDVPEPEQSTMSAATHAEFLELMQRYGRSWTKISSVMKTRTEPQVRSHAQKHFLRINKEEGVDPAAKRPRTNAGGHLAPNELPRHLAAGSPDAAHVAAFGRSATPWTGPSPYASYGAPAYGGVYPQAGFVPPGPYGAHPGAYAQAAQALYSLPQAAPPPAGYAPPPAGYAPPPAGYAAAAAAAAAGAAGQAAPAGVALGLLQQLEQLPPDQKHALLQAAMTNVTTPTPAAPQEPSGALDKATAAAIARERAATVEDVQDWLRALGLGRYHDEVAAKRINGRVLLCLVTNECLAQLGITSGADVATILWTVEAQIKAGDEGAHAIVDPSIFLSVADASRSTAEAAKARKRASVPGAARAEDSDEERAPKPKRDDDVDDDDDDDDEGFAAPSPTSWAPDVPPETPVDGARKAPGGRHVMCETCQSMYWSASGATKTCRVCRQREEELAELKRREAEALRGDHMAPNVRAEYEVSFLDRGPLNMVLEELDLYKIVVRGFTPTDDGAVGFAESCGKIAVDDELVGVNGLAVDRLKFNESIELIRSAEPTRRVGRWPVPLVALCRDVFRDRAPSALPAKAAPPVVAGGVRAIFAGATSISGFLLVKVPGDPAVRRFFGKLVGNRLQFHRPSKHAEAGYLPEPAVAIAMERVALVTYGAPGLLGGAWRIASDECHATRCCVKGLKPDTTYVVRVRALHELSRGTTLWGDWSGTSKRLATDRVRYGARGRDPSHCWILVHGLHGTPFDMSHLAAAVEARCPSDALVHVAEANAGRTLDGVAAGGDRLVREISSVLRGKPKVDKLSFVCHDLGGLYARYALKALWAGGAVREWDEGGGEPAPSRGPRRAACRPRDARGACGWDRVDVFNAGLMNNADLIVRREWMNAPGFDVVKHFLDHAALS